MAVSLMLRRSGIAVGLVADCLKWRADLVVQVGVGSFHEEVAVLKEEWPGVEFVGFEANERVYNGLTHALHPYPGKVYNLAVSDHEGKGTLRVKEGHADGSSLYELTELVDQVVTEQPVKTTTLDAFFLDEIGQVMASLSRVRVLLWLDCEGSELDALLGGERFLERVDVVNVEMTYKPPSPSWGSPGDIHHFLADRGFWLQWLHTQRISAGQCDGVYVRERLFRPEYCCVPHEVERFNSREGKA